MNKLNELKESVHIKTVLDYLGYPYTKKGLNYFCKCPVPGHNDKHDTNCHFKDNWYKLYCEACGSSISSIDLIMYVSCCDIREAIKVLWEICGCPEWFIEKPTDAIILNKRQRQLLNWKPNPQITVPTGITPYKPKDNKYYIENEEIYIQTKVISVSNSDFALPEELLTILFNKCTEKLLELKTLCLEFCNDQELLNILYSDLREMNDLHCKVRKRLKKELAY